MRDETLEQEIREQLMDQGIDDEILIEETLNSYFDDDMDDAFDYDYDPNYCDQCGHYSAIDAWFETRDGVEYVVYNDESSCYNWITKELPVKEFIEWYDLNGSEEYDKYLLPEEFFNNLKEHRE